MLFIKTTEIVSGLQVFKNFDFSRTSFQRHFANYDYCWLTEVTGSENIIARIKRFDTNCPQ